MFPRVLIQIALIIVVVRCVYVLINQFQSSRKMWLEILFNAAIAYLALSFLL